MEVTRSGQTFYPQEADALVPEGCIAVGNEHGGCLDRGCRWCDIYYTGLQPDGTYWPTEALEEDCEALYW